MESAHAQIEPLPMALRWLGQPVSWQSGSGWLEATAGPRSDFFVDPAGAAPSGNAPALVGEPSGDFVLAARVNVDFASTFDAGALLLHRDEEHWAKLCFEYSPQSEPMVVSVVTRGVSDDCNSFVVDGHEVWLRIARIGDCFAFHASTDGILWRMIRYFSLGEGDGIAVGFEAQSPTGEGCAVRFDQIRYEARTLGDLRSGE